MKRQKRLVDRMQEVVPAGWIVSLEGEIIDLMISDSEDVSLAEQVVLFMIESFAKESGDQPVPIKYNIWNRHQSLSDTSDPNHRVELIGIDEALRNGAEAMHKLRKSKGPEKMSLKSMFQAGAITDIGSLLEPKNEQIYFLVEGGFLVEISDNPHRTDVVGFFQGPCIVIPMSPLNQLKVVGNAPSILSFDTKHAFALMHQYAEARHFYKKFKADNFARTDKYFNDLRSKTVAERYGDLLLEHPWVVMHVDEEDIASYLKISIDEYRKIRNPN